MREVWLGWGSTPLRTCSRVGIRRWRCRVRGRGGRQRVLVVDPGDPLEAAVDLPQHRAEIAEQVEVLGDAGRVLRGRAPGADELALQLALGKGAPHGDPQSAIPNSQFTYTVVPFDQILTYVRDGHADAGLIIHEGQLTFANQNLHLVVDLGQWWHAQTQLPLPLGGNCIRKDLGADAMQVVTDVLKASIQYSLDHRQEAVQYALQFGRDLNRDLADRFVGMYVNHWTLDYGPRGRLAISTLLQRGADAGLVPPIDDIQYITAR